MDGFEGKAFALAEYGWVFHKQGQLTFQLQFLVVRILSLIPDQVHPLLRIEVCLLWQFPDDMYNLNGARCSQDS